MMAVAITFTVGELGIKADNLGAFQGEAADLVGEGQGGAAIGIGVGAGNGDDGGCGELAVDFDAQRFFQIFMALIMGTGHQ